MSTLTGGEWHERLDALAAMAVLMEQIPADPLLRALVWRRIEQDLAELAAGARVMAAEAEQHARQDESARTGSAAAVPVPIVHQHPQQPRGGGEWWQGQDPRMPRV